jgi:hypothetical protein
MSKLRSILWIAVLAGGRLWAVDGVVLIDQNRALAGNVTPGDAPGYPISITQPGSYRLSGNLSVPSGQHGFVLGATNVTLDLNGFSITTPTQAVLDGDGIRMADNVDPLRIVIRNGTIQGFQRPLWLANISASYQRCQFCVFEALILQGVPLPIRIIHLGRHARIEHVTTAPELAIEINCPSVAVTNVVLRGIEVDTPNNATLNPGVCVIQQTATF